MKVGVKDTNQSESTAPISSGVSHDNGPKPEAGDKKAGFSGSDRERRADKEGKVRTLTSYLVL